MFVYKVVSEDLRFLGHMGAGTETNWELLAKDLKTAKKLAEDDLGEKIKWTKSNNQHTSGDLGHVMYTIWKEQVHQAATLPR